MARIEGADIPGSKRLEYALTYIFGVGLKRSRDVLRRLNISFDKRARDLSDEEIAAIQRDISDHYLVEGELRKDIVANIRRFREIGCYKGMRHRRGLPVRGQRTRTNARTRKGPRKAGSIVALKRKITKK